MWERVKKLETLRQTKALVLEGEESHPLSPQTLMAVPIWGHGPGRDLARTCHFLAFQNPGRWQASGERDPSQKWGCEGESRGRFSGGRNREISCEKWRGLLIGKRFDEGSRLLVSPKQKKQVHGEGERTRGKEATFPFHYGKGGRHGWPLQETPLIS
jgi:hypothetical protein